MSGNPKKYPEERANDDGIREFEDVYAGPEEMEDIIGNGRDESEISCVYAGPEMFENNAAPEKKEEKKKEDKPRKRSLFGWNPFKKRDVSRFSGVYAGPEMMNRGRGFEKVYAGPVRNPGDEDKITEEDRQPVKEMKPEPGPGPEIAAPVYAGPAPKAESEMRFVYAGPRFFENQFMAVYAGPEQMNRMGAAAPLADQTDPNRQICEKCGAQMPKDYRFCGYCGAKLPERNVCRMCGAEKVEGSKFCVECGARYDEKV